MSEILYDNAYDLGSALMAPAVLHAQQGDQFFGSYKVSAFKSSFEQTKNTYVSGGSYDSEYITEDVAQDTVGKADNCARYRQETYSRFGNNKTTNDRVYCDLIGKVFNISSNFGPNGICNPIEMPMTGYLSIMENLKIPGCVIQDKRFRFNSSSNKYEISYSPDKYLPYNYISLEKNPDGTVTFVKETGFRYRSGDGSSYGHTRKETFILEVL